MGEAAAPEEDLERAVGDDAGRGEGRAGRAVDGGDGGVADHALRVGARPGGDGAAGGVLLAHGVVLGVEELRRHGLRRLESGTASKRHGKQQRGAQPQRVPGVRPHFW